MEKPWICSDEDSFSLEVPEHFYDARLDQFLALSFEEFSRSQLSESVKSGLILVNGSAAKPGYRLKPGDIVSGNTPIEVAAELPEPQDVDFSVLLEDSDFLIIAKPPGLVVHPGSGNSDMTLVNGLLYRYRDLLDVGDGFRPGIVHRLDKDTSGVMVIARTQTAHIDLVNQLKNRLVEKTYLALIHGVPNESNGRIVAPIGRHPLHRQKMAIREQSGRYAVTNWKCKQKYENFTLVEVLIETGRTHQIRVHTANLGFPVAGDRVYGTNRDKNMFPRQMLHAWQLKFKHPLSKENVEAVAELPEDFKNILDKLGEN